MTTVVVETLIEAPIEICFDLARSLETHQQSTSSTQETVISRHEHDLLDFGDEVTFEAVHFWVRQRLTARIVEYQRPDFFVDQMIRGAFKSLKHEHRFEPLSAGTRMTDLLHFESPMWLIGKLTDRLLLAGYLERFLKTRAQFLKVAAEKSYKRTRAVDSRTSKSQGKTNEDEAGASP